MAFMDLFRPKWKHSNPEVRLKAIKKRAWETYDLFKITDRKHELDEFKDIARGQYLKNNSLWNGKLLTLGDEMDYSIFEEIQSQNVLADIAENAKHFGPRKQSIERLDAEQWQPLLARIAQKDTHTEVRIAAVRKLRDQALIIKIAEHDEEVRSDAVEFIEDETLLADYAKHGKPWWVRRSALKSVKNPNILVWNAINDEEWKVRRVAIERIIEVASQPGLSKILTEVARESLKEPHIDDWNYCMKLIFDNINDQELMADVAKNAKNEKYQYRAVLKLDPEKWQKLLADIATDKDRATGDVRSMAVKKLEDQKILAECAKNDKDDHVRWDAVDKLDSKKWQELLADIAKNDEYYMTRIRAVEKLDFDKWRHLLIDISKNDKDKSVCRHALEKLGDIAEKDIAKNDIYHFSEFANKIPCPKCGKNNSISKWPKNGDSVGWFCEDERGNYSLPVTCSSCNRDFYVNWDNNPGPFLSL